MVSPKQMKGWLPKRSSQSNKTDGGNVLIIAGSKGFHGAGLLSALAATRSGAGYTHLMSDIEKFPWLKFPDFIVHPLKLSELKKLKNQETFSVGIGPGLGLEKSKLSYLRALIKNNFSKVTVDADALTLLAKHQLAPLPASWILTPHEGELGRLLGISSTKVKADRNIALMLAGKKYQCTILLKGSETLVYSPETKTISSVRSGTAALSKAGTGDVLLGIITAFRAQGLDPDKAALLGATIHGLAARAWELEGNDQLSLRPLDLIEKISTTLFLFRNS